MPADHILIPILMQLLPWLVGIALLAAFVIAIAGKDQTVPQNKKPRERIDWIGWGVMAAWCIHKLLAWGVVAAWLIYMLPVFAIMILANLVGLGPDGTGPGSRTYRGHRD